MKRHCTSAQGKKGGAVSALIKKANVAARQVSAAAGGKGAVAAVDHGAEVAGGAAAAADYMPDNDVYGGAAAPADFLLDVADDGAAAAADYDFDPVNFAPAHDPNVGFQFMPFDSPDAIFDRVYDEYLAETAAACNSTSFSSSSASGSAAAAATIPLQPTVAARGQRIPLFDINSHANGSGSSMHSSGFRRYTGLGSSFVDCHLHDSEIPCPPHLVRTA